MTPREAIQILMLSPIYFRLDPAERKQLIKEYCELFSQIVAEQRVTIRRSNALQPSFCRLRCQCHQPLFFPVFQLFSRPCSNRTIFS